MKKTFGKKNILHLHQSPRGVPGEKGVSHPDRSVMSLQ